jgi:DNA-binding transcriptional MerR regulator
MADVTIGHLARATGCKIPTIRYYEQIGLLPAARRSAGNQRLYGTEHVARLAFIRHGRELGFSQAEIRDLLELSDDPDQPCESVTRIAARHLDQIKERIDRLSALMSELERMIGACRGRKISECRILEALAGDSIDLHHRVKAAGPPSGADSAART